VDFARLNRIVGGVWMAQTIVRTLFATLSGEFTHKPTSWLVASFSYVLALVLIQWGVIRSKQWALWIALILTGLSVLVTPLFLAVPLFRIRFPWFGINLLVQDLIFVYTLLSLRYMRAVPATS
jgi:hypothetical protein